MNRVGRVISINNGICELEFEKPSSCKSCGQCNLNSTTTKISIEGNYNIGDYVEVYLPEKQFLKATAIAYMIPLFGLVAGLSLGYYLPSSFGFQGNDFTTLIGGLFGIGICLLGLWVSEKQRKTKASWEPYIIGKPTNKNIYSALELTENINKKL